VVSVITYLLMGNVSEITVVLAGLVLFPELLVPLAATQLLWVNLITDGLPALALGVDRPAHEPLNRPPRSPSEQVLGWKRLASVVWRGLVVGSFVLLVGVISRWLGADPAVLQTQLLMTLIAGHLLLAYVARSDGGPFESGWWKNRWVIFTIGASLALQFLAVAVPFTRAALELQPLPLSGWILAALGAVAGIATVEAIRLVHRGFRARGARNRND
jgi:P-type Ca2+ transporter type 2C